MPRGVANIDGSQFHILSADEVRKRSVVEISDHVLNERTGCEPRPNGVLDLRLGPIEPRFRCATCGGSVRTCTGHTGHIELPFPVYNVIFLPQILFVLRCICCACARPLLSLDRMQDLVRGILRRQDRLSKISSVAKEVQICPHTDCCMPVCSYAKTKSTEAASGQVTEITRKWSEKAHAMVLSNEKHVLIMKTPFTACTAYVLFSLVSDEHWLELGFDQKNSSNPRDMIITTLIVPPAIIRPTSFHYDSGQGRGTNDLTAALQDILRQSNKIRLLLPTELFDGEMDVVRTLDSDNGSVLPIERGPIDHLLLFEIISNPRTPPSKMLLESVSLLQQCVNAYIFNDPRSTTQTGGSGGAGSMRKLTTGGTSSQRSGAPRTSLLGRLKGPPEHGGKEGRLRHSCLGKRCDNTARSVIVPDPHLDIDELGVPEYVASILVVRDRVCGYNLEDLSKRVKYGPSKPNGAVSIIRAADSEIGCGNEERDLTIDLRAYDSSVYGPLILHIGDIVERHLCNGDYIVFNRQPSLHRLSMMCFRIRIVPDLAFHLNPAITTPFNADFDGDEMNAHVATDIKGMTEMRNLMSVSAQILSGQTNSPCAGLVQDAIIGCWKLTDPKTMVTRSEMMDYIMQLEATHRIAGRIGGKEVMPPPVKIQETDGKAFWTGLQVVSLPIPKNFTWYNEEKTIVVENGQVIVGRFTKKIIGPGGILFGALIRKCGPVRAIAVLSDLQRIALRFLEQHGFSCGARDTLISPLHSSILKCKINVVIQDIYKEVFDRSVLSTPSQREYAIVQNLGTLVTRIGESIPTILPKNNAFLQMFLCGSKGTSFNLSQITSALGQTLVLGKRPNPHADDIMLVDSPISVPFLPCCYSHSAKKHDIDTSAIAFDRGFIKNSYVQGLTPKEYFIHAMGGREGLVDSAVRTSESGYAQRKFMKALEDLKIEHDGSVRDAAQNIVQFTYGNDGYEPSQIIRQSVDKKVAKCVALTSTLLIDRIIPQNIEKIDIKSTFPFYLSDIEQVANETESKSMSDTSPPPSNCFSTIFHRDYENIFTWREFIVLENLLSGRSSEAIYAGLKMASECVYNSKVHPGESVGAVAAHSIAQPATQMTLNSFHVAGKSQRHALGINRLFELIDVRGKRGSSTMVVEIPVKPPWQHTELETESESEIVVQMRHLLVEIILNNVISNYDIVPSRQLLPDDILPETVTSISMSWKSYQQFCKNSSLTLPISNIQSTEALWLAKAIALGEIDWINEKRHPKDYCIRFIVSNSMMVKYNLDIETIRMSIAKSLCGAIPSKPDWIVISSDNIDPKMNIIRAYCVSSRGRGGLSFEICSSRARQIMASTLVRGVRGVSFVEYDNLTHVIRVMGPEALDAVLITKCEALDYNSLYCNSPVACSSRFGIDYGSMILASEVWRIMRSNNTYIDPRHISILADFMTHRGYLVPINRHGLNRLNTDPIVRCCFEQATDVFRNAALFNETSVMNSVSERLVFGQPVLLGTGTVEIRERDPQTTQTEKNFQAVSSYLQSTTMHCTEIGLLPNDFCDWKNSENLIPHMQQAPSTCASIPQRSAAMWRAGMKLLNENQNENNTSENRMTIESSSETLLDSQSLLPPSKRNARSIFEITDPLQLKNGRVRSTLNKYQLPRRKRLLFRPSTPSIPQTTLATTTIVQPPPIPTPPISVFRKRTRNWRPWSPSAR